MMINNFRFRSLCITLTLGSFIAISTEILNVFNAITSIWILNVWLIFIICIIIYFIFLPKIFFLNKPFFPPAFTKLELSLFCIPCLIMLILLIIALLSPPNTWDSMAYHMARIEHWIQNHNINYYPTQDERQIWKSPWAEYAIMHLQLLCHSDRLANMVQWLSCLGSLVGVSLIAKELGANRLGQIFASVIAVTLPMGLLQATSTQNDYAATFWLVCFVVFVFKWKTQPRLANIIGLGLSLGLAFLTKEINYIYALPLFIWLIYNGIKYQSKHLPFTLLLITTLTLLINAPHYWRNWHLYNHFLSSKETSSSFLIDRFNPNGFISNILLNIGHELKTPFQNFSIFIQNIIENIHALIGTSITTSPANMANFSFTLSPLHEDNAGNFVHVVLIFLALTLFIIFKNAKTNTNRIYIWAINGLFLSFIIFMKWGPFHNRLHILIFILFAPFIADLISRIYGNRTIIIVSLLLTFCSLPWILFNDSRPLLGSKSVVTTSRFKQYFANLQGAPYSYSEAVKEIQRNQCDQIGIDMHEDSWEYPLWVMLKKNNKNIRIESVLGKNATFKKLNYPLGPFKPCAIITKGDREDKMITLNNDIYIPTIRLAFLTVYMNLEWYLKQHPEIKTQKEL